jgi:hypothetical protein
MARFPVSTCRFRGPAFVLLRSGNDEEVAMQYVMLIYQGDALERQFDLAQLGRNGCGEDLQKDHSGWRRVKKRRLGVHRRRRRSLVVALAVAVVEPIR